MNTRYFPDMIRVLRQQEEVILHDRLLQTSDEEDAAVSVFLQQEYLTESAGYPFRPPAYDAAAALWAASTVYMAAQLLLYRAQPAKDLPALFPAYTGAFTPAAMLSADLCLRFLPDMLVQLHLIDPEDPLNAILEGILQQWHYSGIRHELDPAQLDFTIVIADKCLRQLYSNRVISSRNLQLARHPVCRVLVQSDLGMHAATLWSSFNTEMNSHD